VTWFDRDVDLDDLRGPEGWVMPLTATDRATFWRNVHERGSGHSTTLTATSPLQREGPSPDGDGPSRIELG
jgi:hypothetical protein